MMSHLVVLGGLDKDNQILNDCWIMNLSSFMWYKVHHMTFIYIGISFVIIKININVVNIGILQI